MADETEIAEDESYWVENLRAFVDGAALLSDTSRDAVRLGTADDGEDVAAVLPADNLTREERAALINDLQRGGFTVTSSTKAENIHIGYGEKLTEPYTQSYSTKGFSMESYRDTLIDYTLDAFKGYYRRNSLDVNGALSEAVFESAKEYIDSRDYDAATKVLDKSPNEPNEWEPYAEGKTDYKKVIKAMAITVVQQDIYEALEAEGYINDEWNGADKLKSVIDNE